MTEPTRWVFHFMHKTRVVTFGPHEDSRAAKEAFQFRYGYWPEVFLGTDLYDAEATR